MKYLFFNLIILFSCYAMQAQNLVPNPSFEEHTGCPDCLEGVDLSNGWSSYRPTPDYFNKCSQGCSGVPDNFWGDQNPATGNAYSGLTTYYSYPDTREFIGRKLSTALSIGVKYFASIKVSRANSSGLNCATNNLGILFSTKSYNDSLPTKNFAHVYSSSIIYDSLNWVIISGSFIADSAYEYIIIGNFFKDAVTDKFIFYGSDCNAYYYVDDVCVSSDSLECDLNYEGIKDASPFNLITYPNPCDDFINVSNLSQPFALSIFNILGERLYYNSRSKGNMKISTLSFPAGIYFFQVETRDGIQLTKFFIQHTP